MRGVDREPDHVAAAAALQRALVEADEILGLFLDLDLAVAQDAEHALRRSTAKPGKSRSRKSADQLLERHEAACALPRQPDEALELRPAAAAAPRMLLAVAARCSCSARPKPRLGMNGNGCAGSTASGVSTGKICVHEALVEPVALVARSSSPGSTTAMPASAQLVAQLAPARLLVAHQLAGALRDRVELLRRRQAVLARRGDAGEHLAFQAGDADHVELVEIAGRDRQEAQPLEQRMGLVAASSSTRSLKASQDSSRLIKRSGESRPIDRSRAWVRTVTAAPRRSFPRPLALSRPPLPSHVAEL